MTCEDVRRNLLDATRRRLDRERQTEVSAHLESCPDCAAAERSERALDELLASGLPRYAAPASLKRRLALMAGPSTDRHRLPSRPRLARPALATAALLAVVAGSVLVWQRDRASTGAEALTAELVNDHLRVLARDRAVDVESAGTHEVKPWFEGRLDFAPTVPEPDVPDLRLRGGAVGYVFDRKAAVVLYALRRHAITLLVCRPEGLSWPDRPRVLDQRSIRGFHVVSWRAGGLGYALVSDVNPAELADLAARFAAATAPSPAQ